MMIVCTKTPSATDAEFLEDMKTQHAAATEPITEVHVDYSVHRFVPESATPWILYLVDDVIRTSAKTLKTVTVHFWWEINLKKNESDLSETWYVFRAHGGEQGPFASLLKLLGTIADSGVDVVMRPMPGLYSEKRRNMVLTAVKSEPAPTVKRSSPAETLATVMESAATKSVVGVVDGRWTAFETTVKKDLYEVIVPIPIPPNSLTVFLDPEEKSISITNAPYDWENPEARPKIFTSSRFFIPNDVDASAIRVIDGLLNQLTVHLPRKQDVVENSPGLPLPILTRGRELVVEKLSWFEYIYKRVRAMFMK